MHNNAWIYCELVIHILLLLLPCQTMMPGRGSLPSSSIFSCLGHLPPPNHTPSYHAWCCPSTSLLVFLLLEYLPHTSSSSASPYFLHPSSAFVHTSATWLVIREQIQILTEQRWHTWHCLWQLKKGGGLSFNSTLPLTKCSEKLVQLILHEYSILSHLTEITLPPSKWSVLNSQKLHCCHLVVC